MATELGDGFLEPISLIGPYPSGAPAIFIDQVAKLGQPCGMIGCVGDDDFGQVNTGRLRRDGVDVSAIAVDPTLPTGSAFVRYRADGSRDFVYNIRHSASGAIAATPAAEALIEARRPSPCDGHLAVLAGGGGAGACGDRPDPGRRRHDFLRPEPAQRDAGAPGVRAALDRVSAATDLFMPSGTELFALPPHATRPRRRARSSIAASATMVVKKARTVRACTPRTAPGGAGVCRRGGRPDRRRRYLRGDLRHLLAARHCPSRRRCAFECGRRARRPRRGPMEGTSTRAEIDAFLAVARRHDCLRGQPRAAPRAARRAGRHSLGLLGPPLGDRGRAAPRASWPGADRGDLQPGEPGGRLHRHDPGGVPPFRRRRSPTRAASRATGLISAATISARTRGSTCPPRRHGEARGMVDAYAKAGFAKIHLDTSMGCAGEPAALPDPTIAERAAGLAAVAESRRAAAPPVYVIGTEVPVPGGAAGGTRPSAGHRPGGRDRDTVESTARAFAAPASTPPSTARSASWSSPASSSATHGGGRLRARARPAPHRARSKAIAAVRLRGALDRLPAACGPRRTSARRLRDPQGRPGPHLRAPRGALRPRADRRRSLDGEPGAPGRRWSGDAGAPGALAEASTPARPDEQRRARHFSLHRPHPLLLAGRRGRGRRRRGCMARARRADDLRGRSSASISRTWSRPSRPGRWLPTPAPCSWPASPEILDIYAEATGAI